MRATSAANPDRETSEPRSIEKKPTFKPAAAAVRVLEAMLIVAAPLTSADPSPAGRPTIEASDHRLWPRYAGLPIAAQTEAPVGIPVPALAGQSAGAARAALRRAGLNWRQQTQPGEATPPGRVVGTLPSAGELVEKGATVTLIVAAPVKVSVPSVGGESISEAGAALRRLGLNWRRQERADATAPPGTVIGTLPSAGQAIAKGATVTLIVAKAVTPVYRDPATRMSRPEPYDAGSPAVRFRQLDTPYAPGAGAARPPPTTQWSSGQPSSGYAPAPSYPATPPARTPLSGRRADRPPLRQCACRELTPSAGGLRHARNRCVR